VVSLLCVYDTPKPALVARMLRKKETRTEKLVWSSVRPDSPLWP
jgi:very-short-patch-repair endonuclease